MSTARPSSTVPPGKKKAPYPFYLGGLAACSAATITHPLDQSKYRLQTATKKVGLVSTVAKTASEEGIPGLWKGLTATLLRQFTYSITRFAVYEDMKARLAPPGKAAQPSQLALAAATAGAVAGVIGNPAEIVLVRTCSDLNKPLAERYAYRNCIDGLIRIVRDEGASTLFRGLAPNIVRSMVLNICQLASYDTFKAALMTSAGLQDGPVLHFAAGFCAGTFATTMCTPVDVVKSRVQNAAKGADSSVMAVIRTSLAKDGPMVFMRGWTPAWLRLQPQTTLLFLFFERFKVSVSAMRLPAIAGEGGVLG
ncbi:putative DIC1-mitochondrial dicarboxylate carrier [Tilletiaria anomala UBC 951]|uniref:Putative DIC1-mitochondrial dicarboxylate carrier n=1 Tax=Tilletiaria anomala (strain ATCC 24038 / CBS 436.72 / UBC 951) TaxID=1037660 RepID=A0A066WJN6_TILAU|nr:putative DIC1-mitochondrial dicarboxylate carrier [Tilletiaria anomala UBC 951]KDN50835.1 putative DIC1-mitochondrial dicarboxylate carrier [Tilletiaria anomala UBC 951]